MAQPHDGGQRYEVHCSAVVARALQQQLRRAAHSGRGEVFASAFRQIIERLELNPTHFGEPLYRLPSLRMQVRAVAVAPLGVNFAVCEDRPLVFIKGIRLLSEHKS